MVAKKAVENSTAFFHYNKFLCLSRKPLLACHLLQSAHRFLDATEAFFNILHAVGK
jgi:hypothetical protein